MKFVSLALALLLAVGSHAAAMPQADVPNQLAHMRAMVDMGLTNLVEAMKRALDRLDDVEYAELKQRGNERMDQMLNKFRELQSSVSHVTDSFASTVVDATAPIRQSIEEDLEALKTELVPARANLREVLNRHLEMYQTELGPIIDEMAAKHRAEMEATRTRMQPFLIQMRAKVAENAEETKSALLPILMGVRQKLSERLESLKTQVGPYVDEYKQQLTLTLQRMRTMGPEQLQMLRDQLEPVGVGMNEKVQQAVAIIMGMFQQS